MLVPLKLRKLLLYFLVGAIGFLWVNQPLLSLGTTVSADNFIFQGQAELEDKNYQQAIALFQQAEALYAEEGNEEGVIGTQVNQGIVLDQAGRKSSGAGRKTNGEARHGCAAWCCPGIGAETPSGCDALGWRTEGQKQGAHRLYRQGCDV